MVVVEVETFEEFNEYLLNTDDKHKCTHVMVDFFATWCGPCKKFVPTYKELSETYGDTVLFLKIDIDLVPEVAEKYNISGLPTFMIFETGKDQSVYQPIIGTNKDTIEGKLKMLSKTTVLTDDF